MMCLFDLIRKIGEIFYRDDRLIDYFEDQIELLCIYKDDCLISSYEWRTEELENIEIPKRFRRYIMITSDRTILRDRKFNSINIKIYLDRDRHDFKESYQDAINGLNEVYIIDMIERKIYHRKMIYPDTFK